MPRGRQYYDPIVQVPGTVEGEKDLSRIEVFQDESLKWWGRKVTADGSLSGEEPVSDFQRDVVIAAAERRWPGLPVYELRNEGEDSTWEGHGPSPRLWQNSSPETGDPAPPAITPSGGPSSDLGSEAGDEQIPPAVPTEEQVPLRLIPVTEPGAYVLLTDICALLEMWALAFENDKNPSGALALREAADTLKDV